MSKKLVKLERFYIDRKIDTLRPVSAIGIDRFIKKRKIAVYFLDLEEVIYKGVLAGYMKDRSLSCMGLI